MAHPRTYLFAMFIVWTIAFPFSSGLAKAESCKAQPVQDPLVAGRAQSVTFPNGRVIMVIGHMHGARQFKNLSLLAHEGKVEGLSDKEFEKILRDILKENREPWLSDLLQTGYDLTDVNVLRHAEEDEKFLWGLMKKGAIQYVGFEGTQSLFPHYLVERNKARALWMKEFWRRKFEGRINLSEKEMRQALLSGQNGNVYIYLERPDLFRKFPLVGMEDEDVIKQDNENTYTAKLEEALQKLMTKDEAYAETLSEAEIEVRKKQLSPLGDKLVKLYNAAHVMNIDKLTNLEEQIRSLHDEFPPRLAAELRVLTDAIRARVRGMRARDYGSARNLVSLHANVAHFVGLNHLRSTIRYLEDLCLQELNRSRPTISLPAPQISPFVR